MDVDGNRLALTNKSFKKEIEHAIIEQAKGETDFWVFIDENMPKTIQRKIVARFKDLTGCENVLNK